MSHSGYLLLADISGYTEFVTRTEMDHGAEILKSLIQVIVDETRPPLRVQEIEGDAVFSHALTDAFDRGVLLVEMVESMYAAFRMARDDIRRNTTCTCRACACAGDLDLKFIVHHGAFTPRTIGRHEGISGPDVILVHRLLKNRILEVTGCRAYAFITAAAAEALELNDLLADMTPHAESYEHLGNIDGYVYDVDAYWTRELAARRVVVEPEQAFASFSTMLPVPRTVAWEYYTNPDHRRRWFHADTFHVHTQRAGRYGAGTVEHCVHGTRTVVQRTLDWKPMRYVTSSIGMAFNGRMPYTALFNEKDGQTHISIVYGHPQHERPIIERLLRLLTRMQSGQIRNSLEKSFDTYQALIGERHREDATAPAAPLEPS